MASFTAAGQSSTVFLLEDGDGVTYTLDDGAGTFAGTIVLERSEISPTSGYQTVLSFTANDSGTWLNNTRKRQYVRLSCTDYSGDAMTYTLVDSAASPANGLHFGGNLILDENDVTLATFTDEGASLPGTLTVAGDTEIVGALTLTGGFSGGTLEVDDLTINKSLDVSLVSSLTADAAGTQADALQLASDKIVHVVTTVAGDADAVKLPAVTEAGKFYIVVNKNASSSRNLAVYPQTGGSISGQLTNNPALVPYEVAQAFISTGTNTWVQMNPHHDPVFTGDAYFQGTPYYITMDGALEVVGNITGEVITGNSGVDSSTYIQCDGNGSNTINASATTTLRGYAGHVQTAVQELLTDASPATGLQTGTAGVGTTSTSMVKQTGSADYTVDDLNGKFLRINSGGGSGGTPVVIKDTLTGSLSTFTVSGMDNTSVFDIMEATEAVTTLTIKNNQAPILIENVRVTTLDVDACYNVKFVNCEFIGTATVDDCQLVVFESCTFKTAGVVTASNCGKVDFDRCYVAAGGALTARYCMRVEAELYAFETTASVLTLTSCCSADVNMVANDCVATPLVMSGCTYVTAVATGTNSDNYGFTAAKGGRYEMTGSSLSGTLGDFTIDGTADTYVNLALNDVILADTTAVVDLTP
jgi:hypothetical protein